MGIDNLEDVDTHVFDQFSPLAQHIVDLELYLVADVVEENMSVAAEVVLHELDLQQVVQSTLLPRSHCFKVIQVSLSDNLFFFLCLETLANVFYLLGDEIRNSNSKAKLWY